jgi:hypothetical protein
MFIPDPGSRILIFTRIPDPDPQHKHLHNLPGAMVQAVFLLPLLYNVELEANPSGVIVLDMDAVSIRFFFLSGTRWIRLDRKWRLCCVFSYGTSHSGEKELP